MEINKTALNQCLTLSQDINKLGIGISSKRSACEIFSTIVQSSAELGALITAADYIPSREYRLNMIAQAMKEVSRVIYLLNVANASDMFVAGDVADCITDAVNVSESLNLILAEYSKPAEEEPEEEEPEEEEEEDEDGFDEPYEG